MNPTYTGRIFGTIREVAGWHCPLCNESVGLVSVAKDERGKERGDMSKKRDTFIAGRAPYYPNNPTAEAAKHLQNVCRRYLSSRANAHDIDEAVRNWNEQRMAERGKERP